MVDPPTYHLFVAEDRQLTILPGFAAGHAAVFTQRAPYKETPNEDAAALLHAGGGRGAIVVADGCGGMADGAEASRLAIRSLRDTVDAMGSEGSLRSAILDGIERANSEVQALGSGAGTTVVAVELDGDWLRAYNVGDSQALVVGGRGKVKLQTSPHSPVGYAVEAGVISEQEAILHEDRHIVSNVVGSRDTRIEIGPRRRLSRRDTLVVASDGLFDNLHVEEIVAIIRKGSLEDAANRLVEEVTARMGNADDGQPSKPDDLTFVLFRLEP